MNPKNRKARNEEYLEWQREKVCVICKEQDVHIDKQGNEQRRVDPHHWSNSGGRHGNDCLTVPLCRAHHSRLHHEKDSEAAFWNSHNIDPMFLIINYLIDWIEENEE